MENARIALDGVASQEHMFVLTESLDDLLLDLSALAGASMESVVRGPGWMFWDLGRRVDRALLTLGLIEETLVAIDDIAPVAEVVLASCESLIAYRRRYRSDLRVDALLDLVVFDSSNPRSVAFQLDRIRDHHATLPQQYPEMTDQLLQAAEALAEGMARRCAGRGVGGRDAWAVAALRRRARRDLVQPHRRARCARSPIVTAYQVTHRTTYQYGAEISSAHLMAGLAPRLVRDAKRARPSAVLHARADSSGPVRRRLRQPPQLPGAERAARHLEPRGDELGRDRGTAACARAWA